MLVFVPNVLALCSMLAAADYAQINARLIGATLKGGREKTQESQQYRKEREYMKS